MELAVTLLYNVLFNITIALYLAIYYIYYIIYKEIGIEMNCFIRKSRDTITFYILWMTNDTKMIINIMRQK